MGSRSFNNFADGGDRTLPKFRLAGVSDCRPRAKLRILSRFFLSDQAHPFFCCEFETKIENKK